MSTEHAYQFRSLRKIRALTLHIMQDLTLEQLNYVPVGFNNNIIWNAAHLVVAQQGVCYLRAGLPMMISNEFYSAYKPGSKPAEPLTVQEVDYVKELLLTSIDQFESDFAKGIFENYTQWTTRYGVELASINDALDFLPFHEGMHVGYMMAIKRLLIT
jgi:hypothetical protein